MQKIPIKEFAGRIHDSLTRHSDNKLVFFLGAGCSISSGISSAGGLTKQWMDDLKKAKGLAESAWEAYRHQHFPHWNDDPAQHYEAVYQQLFPKF